MATKPAKEDRFPAMGTCRCPMCGMPATMTMYGVKAHNNKHGKPCRNRMKPKSSPP